MINNFLKNKYFARSLKKKTNTLLGQKGYYACTHCLFTISKNLNPFTYFTGFPQNPNPPICITSDQEHWWIPRFLGWHFSNNESGGEKSFESMGVGVAQLNKSGGLWKWRSFSGQPKRSVMWKWVCGFMLFSLGVISLFTGHVVSHLEWAQQLSKRSLLVYPFFSQSVSHSSVSDYWDWMCSGYEP